jgi:3-(3-hydroxy-phenyl)propionate hydroxylase
MRVSAERVELGAIGASCQVGIVGLGPVGATLAALLGERGISVIAVDPAKEPTAYPRAIAADDEMFRTLIRLPGLADPSRLFDSGQRAQVRDARHRLITTVAFEDSPLGVPGLSFFHQPSLERAMRVGLAELPDVKLRLGRQVMVFGERPDGLQVELDDGSGFTAQWLIGCDGAASTVRRQLGIPYTGRTFGEPWVVVDVDSPDPLAHLPYFSYVLDPKRPAVNMPRPGGHRFEFMLLRGEDPAEMATPAQVDRWLEPYLAPLNPQARARLKVVRAAVYTFHARAAARWRQGRVLLAGDAAHCMPPFGGQGLGAGIGDVLALAWRLNEVCRRLSRPALLDDYERERRPRISEMTRTALVAGRILTATSKPGAAATRLGLQAVDAAPLLGRRFRAGALRAPARVPVPVAERRHSAGRPLPNPRIRTRDGRLLRLDDVLPVGWVLMGRAADPWPRLGLEFAEALRTRSCGAVVVVTPGGFPACGLGATDSAIEDLDGSLLALWRGRPEAVALARPDRFLAGVAGPGALADAFFRLVR